MKVWSRALTQEGPSVALTEVPFWAWAVQELCEMAEESSHVLGGCLIDPPEWAWSVKWGPDGEDGYNPRSLGHALNQLGNSLCGGFGAWRKERTIYLPVTREWIAKTYPGDMWLREFEDEDGDQGVPSAEDV